MRVLALRLGPVGGLKLAHKSELAPWIAIVSSFGFGYSLTGWTIGPDVGLLFARPRGLVRPYIGVRFVPTFALTRENESTLDLQLGALVAPGLAFVVNDKVTLTLEGGLFFLGARRSPETEPDEGRRWGRGFAGGYGSLSVQLFAGKRRSAPR